MSAKGVETHPCPARSLETRRICVVRWHEVSGTNLGYRIFDSGTNTYEDGRTVQRGYGSYDTIEMDDARLSGTSYHVWNRDYLPFGQVLTGTVELVNDGGSWIGTMRGYKRVATTGRWS